MGKALRRDGRVISGHSDNSGFCGTGLCGTRLCGTKLCGTRLCALSRRFYIKKIISVTIKNAAAVRAGCFSQFLGHFFSIIRMTAENIR